MQNLCPRMQAPHAGVRCSGLLTRADASQASRPSGMHEDFTCPRARAHTRTRAHAHAASGVDAGRDKSIFYFSPDTTGADGSEGQNLVLNIFRPYVGCRSAPVRLYMYADVGELAVWYLYSWSSLLCLHVWASLHYGICMLGCVYPGGGCISHRLPTCNTLCDAICVDQTSGVSNGTDCGGAGRLSASGTKDLLRQV